MLRPFSESISRVLFTVCGFFALRLSNCYSDTCCQIAKYQ
ncbi:Uncharacterised protein [Serratia fonticola]|uniref:Uncharacterized protein n=1 Tax=Serratia fonticola TaxID=47917 RepID=A0A448SVV4_SERFO|nr:Uncharacterised protein [Serratia fonticola]CAI1586854.1 Uncharacterised protein [Serratia fonticola]CAI1597040.1 Uncharacterised protein [Serratia fonticola]CAI1700319.1 Uncharacterised protein [Serratia fonticola]CAI1740987.1 Uncharacterised protein [Serratia fonticola]